MASSVVLVRRRIDALDKKVGRLSRRGSIRSRAHAKQAALQADNLNMMIRRRSPLDQDQVFDKTGDRKKISRLCKKTNKRIDSSVSVMKRLERLVSSSMNTFNRGEEHMPWASQNFYHKSDPRAGKKRNKRSPQPPMADTLDAWSWVSTSGEKRRAWGVSQALNSAGGCKDLFGGMHSGGTGMISGGAGIPGRLPGQTISMVPRPPLAPRPSQRGRVVHSRAWIGAGGHNKPKLGR
jgi:hypothetical protein